MQGAIWKSCVVNSERAFGAEFGGPPIEQELGNLEFALLSLSKNTKALAFQSEARRL